MIVQTPKVRLTAPGADYQISLPEDVCAALGCNEGTVLIETLNAGKIVLEEFRDAST